MNFFKKLLSVILTAIMCAAAINPAVFAEPAVSGEITSENVSLEFVSASYRGAEIKPKTEVTAGGQVLVQGRDYTVQYPEDCISAGRKTVLISGAGGFSGSVSAEYEITPLDGSDKNPDVAVLIESGIVYDGISQTPAVTVSAFGSTLEENVDYMLTFRNNIDAGESAMCDVAFIGNCYGSRTVPFEIKKAPSEDMVVYLNVNPETEFKYDLSKIKPADAVFGIPDYQAEDFNPENKPKISFNELKFTLAGNAPMSSRIVIPVTRMKNYEDYNIYFYIMPTDKGVPKLTVKTVTKVYDGEPLPEDILSRNGSFAEYNGEIISGEWVVYEDFPVEPCDKKLMTVTFIPDDENLSEADGVLSVTINRIVPNKFSVGISPRKPEPGSTARITVSGIPDGCEDRVFLTGSGFGEGDFIVSQTAFGENKKIYDVEFPYKDELYTFTAQFGGSEHYAPCTAECEVVVGEPDLPEEQLPEKVTSIEELEQMIAEAETGAEIKAEGLKTVPAELVKAAAEKQLVLCMKLNDNYRWIIDTAKLTRKTQLDLSITAAAVPFVLLDQVGGEKGLCFNVFEKNIAYGAELEVSAGSEIAGETFANLFLYNTKGELEFVSCARVDAGKKARLKVFGAGKYAVMTDSETKMYGDFNNDCYVDMLDARYLLEHILSDKITDDFNLNGDECIDVLDVRYLIKYALSL